MPHRLIYVARGSCLKDIARTMTSHPFLDYVAPINCTKCPRLSAYLKQSNTDNPDWHNAPVPSFGSIDSSILILGLAPGLRGANRTGRPFTGDFAGDLLYQTLLAHQFASGEYHPNGQDTLTLNNVRIANAVRCVPPLNKPIGSEINNCRPFLSTEIERMHNLKVVLCLGRIAHDTLIRHFQLPAKSYAFSHCKEHRLNNRLFLLNSYHCSRYNINTSRLTQHMFDNVFIKLKQIIKT
jgi:uracil-DNA glycosylase